MRFLIVGAGALGGYYGGRLIQIGRDVTFLVRPRRAGQLAATGLTIKSPLGDAALPPPQTLTQDTLRETFDVVLLGCKAYDLTDAADAMAPAVGAQTAIIPVLNGLMHIDYLTERFGAQRVLGGQAQIAATLDDAGGIVHMSPFCSLSFGEVAGGLSDRATAIAQQMAGAQFDSQASADIMLEMWEKWTFLATLAGATGLMRAPVGDIITAGGGDFLLALFEECAAIAAASGYAPRKSRIDLAHKRLAEQGSLLTASMLRDIENGTRIEADHVIGDLLRRARPGAAPLLKIAYTHLKAYEARRARTAVTAAG